VQTLLVGQPELREKMARPELRQFAQRVAVDFHLQSLSLTEAEAYVKHRLVTAGGSESIFQRKAIECIHRRSGGIPRLMNQLCDLSLVYAYADRRERISAALVEKVLQDRTSGRASSLFSEHADSVGAGSSANTMPSEPAPSDGEVLRENP
jgi:type II secretory pathway predicted ATPase ExeA